MNFSHRALLSVALIAFSMLLSGCPLLFIGSLGYTGYQYHEKEGIFAPGQPLGGPAPEDPNDKSSSSNSNSKPAPPPTDNSIE